MKPRGFACIDESMDDEFSLFGRIKVRRRDCASVCAFQNLLTPGIGPRIQHELDLYPVRSQRHHAEGSMNAPKRGPGTEAA